MGYTEAKARKLELEAEAKRTGRALRALSGDGPMGLTTERVRATPEWKAAKEAARKAHIALQNFNAVYVKQFKREIIDERRAREKPPAITDDELMARFKVNRGEAPDTATGIEDDAANFRAALPADK